MAIQAKVVLFALILVLRSFKSNGLCPSTTPKLNLSERFVICNGSLPDSLPRVPNNDIKYVACELGHIQRIPSELLSVFPNVIEMCFSNNNKLHAIERGAFDKLSKLEKLYLRENNVSEISRGTLNFLKSLQILDLSRNGLTKIQAGALDGLLNLKLVNLSRNNLQDLTFLNAATLENLETLDLSFNALAEIDDDALKHLINLKELLLVNNSLKRFNFALLPLYLRKLNVSNNALDTIDTRSWLHLRNVEVVDLRANKIDEILPVGGQIVYFFLRSNRIKALGSSIFTRSANINELDLAHNLIEQIHPDSFEKLERLEYLYLDHNKLMSLPGNCFKDLSSLKFLFLSDNILTSVGQDTLAGLKRLKELSLHHNKIARIEGNAFQGLVELKYLHLQHNALKSIDADTLLLHSPRLATINIDNNVWSCKFLQNTLQVLEVRGVNFYSSQKLYSVVNVLGIPCEIEHLVHINVFDEE